MILIDQELCTGCRRCAEVCPVDAIQGEPGKPQSIDQEICVRCGQCVQVCSGYMSILEDGLTPREQKLAERGYLPSVKEPLFAAYYEGRALKVKEALADPDKFCMVQVAPAVRVGIAEEFGMPYGTLAPGKMAAALRRLGFDRVYSTDFAADLTIMEEGNELVQRLTKGGVLPMFTSCCPAWVKYLEQTYPELLPHLSSCKSPQQMAGAVFKTYGAKIDKVDPAKIFSVSVMPCTAKDFEANRPEMKASGYQDVDVAITTRELAQLIKDAGIDFNSLPEEEYDRPLGTYSGAGTIFGATGGVMEAALRTAYEVVTKKPIPDLNLTQIRGGEGVRYATIKMGDLEVKVCVVAGLKNVAPILEQVKAGKADFHFMEVMACPVGCVSGGGQPKALLPTHRDCVRKARLASQYKHDEQLPVRKSHENPDIKKLYKEFLGEPLGRTSHHLLHTTYTPRRRKA